MSEMNHDFCAKFRAELKAYGLKQVVIDMLNSSREEKVELKKQYLAREVQKKQKFLAEFNTVCLTIGDENRQLRPTIAELKKQIVG